MIIVGVDYHPSVQQVAFLDTETGETSERRLNHSDGEAERFYRDLEGAVFLGPHRLADYRPNGTIIQTTEQAA